MKKTYLTFVLLLTIALVPNIVYGQCKGFAKKICKTQLVPYIHDGNYHSAILTEGEEADLYKTFYSGQQYRIAICGSEDLPDVQFQVLDLRNKVLYDNKKQNLSKTWDFKLESSQQLKIVIKVPVLNETGEDIISGCVSIMFGFKD